VKASTKAQTIHVVASILALIFCILLAVVFAICVAAIVRVFGLDGAETKHLEGGML
jgi:hypothetical protein